MSRNFPCSAFSWPFKIWFKLLDLANLLMATHREIHVMLTCSFQREIRDRMETGTCPNEILKPETKRESFKARGQERVSHSHSIAAEIICAWVGFLSTYQLQRYMVMHEASSGQSIIKQDHSFYLVFLVILLTADWTL